MKKCAQSALLIALSLALLSYAYVRSERRVIRMHVIAQSNTDVDQAIKLQVRNALLPMVHAALQSDSPRESLEALLPALSQRAEEIACIPVTATLSQESYAARFDCGSYLPAGRYTALRITLGEGQGHNWWSVVYPEREEREVRWWIVDWFRDRNLN